MVRGNVRSHVVVLLRVEGVVVWRGVLDFHYGTLKIYMCVSYNKGRK